MDDVRVVCMYFIHSACTPIDFCLRSDYKRLLGQTAVLVASLSTLLSSLLGSLLVSTWSYQLPLNIDKY